jgi:arabinofuranosyltransferase
MHALWVLLLSGVYCFSEEAYYSTLVLSMALSVLAFSLTTVVLARDATRALLAGILMLLSKAFVDYSTSGLENPATYFLLCTLAIVATAHAGGRGGVVRVSLMGSLAVLNRLDLVWLVAPTVLAAVLASKRPVRDAALAVAGSAPLLGWIAFATVYYGTWIPSPAHAKVFGLDSGRGAILRQGLGYLNDSLVRDPLTLSVIAAAIVVAALRRNRVHVALMAGVACYLAYVVWIGGDFMSGRFLAAPFLVAVIVVAQSLPRESPRTAMLALAIAATLGARALPSTLFTGPEYDDQNPDRRLVVDCRGFSFQNTGLISAGRRRWPNLGRVSPPAELPPMLVLDSVGKVGFSGGPGVHIVDHLALCDPLLSRMPPIAHDDRWMAAHLRRHIPTGYLSTLRTGTRRLADPNIAEFHRRIQHRPGDRAFLALGRAAGGVFSAARGPPEQPAGATRGPSHRDVEPRNPRGKPACAGALRRVPGGGLAAL